MPTTIGRGWRFRLVAWNRHPLPGLIQIKRPTYSLASVPCVARCYPRLPHFRRRAASGYYLVTTRNGSVEAAKTNWAEIAFRGSH